MKKLLKIIAPVLVLVVSIGVVQALSAAKPAPEKKEESQRLISLYVDEVKSDTVTISVQTQGEVRPKTEIDLIPQVSGRIVGMSESFAEGAEFSPGETLVKIDDTNYKLAVVRAEARVSEAKVAVERELANAKIKKEHWLDKRNAGEPTPYALNKPQVLDAQAKLAAAEADLQEARLNVARTEINVPFLGRVRQKNVGIGQYVTAGTPLGRVFSTDTVEIRLPLTDVQLEELNLPMGYMADAFNAPVVKFSAHVGNREHSWTGRIVRTHASVDQQTRLIYAIAEVQDPYGIGSDNGTPIAVGMFVHADIASANTKAALVLPRLALRSANKVYVINDQNRLEIRTVEILSTSDETVLVSTGVKVGDKVVTSTIPAAVDGMEVRAITREQQS
ncbi:MAG: efflux RND transporter periplasmic adaptor subunit [Xanthomonadales bacterium]|nr:efflux RND transporter periplasmic adaptor subunit [Gammaproteobacteria bacterium]MBT8072157.1 efflux RND transporter periplasmic adaptor subunit [Gammaproteobacteria bacterium]NNK02997.1 efflux RND transporter periplasmic adaptor subunit [Xanthomonadales bacterium]